MVRKIWTREEIDYLKANYSDTNTSVLAAHLGRSLSSVFGAVGLLGLTKSEAFRNSPLSGRLRPGAKIGGGTRFKKGNVAFNKGKKQSEFMSPESIQKSVATRFKKGNVPGNVKEDGAISIRKSKGRPYKWTRVAMGEWRELHRLVWEQHHGPVPEGFNVQFKDKNSLNCEPENLYLITREDQLKNENSIHRYPAEVKSAIHTLAKLKRKINHHEKQN
jgi:hypothetical protein